MQRSVTLSGAVLLCMINLRRLDMKEEVRGKRTCSSLAH